MFTRAIATLVPVLILLVALWQWDALRHQELLQGRRTVESAAEGIREDLSQQAEANIKALEQMAARWSVSGRPSQAVWEADAGNLFRDFPSLQAVEWVDPKLTIRWIVPLKGNEKALGLDLLFERRRAQAVLRARHRGIVTFSKPIHLVQGGDGVLIYVPIFHRGRFDGLLVGVVPFDRLAKLLPEHLRDGYAFALEESGQPFYRHGLVDAPEGKGWQAVTRIQVREAVWNVRVAPTAAMLATYRTQLPAAILAVGIACSALMAVLIQSAFRVRAQHTRTQTILASITDAFITFDRAWRFTFVNAEAERLMQRSGKDLLGRVVWEEFPEACETDWFREYHRAVLENVPVAFEVYGQAKRRWHFVRAYPSSEGLTVYIKEVTDRKLREAQIADSEARLAEAERVTRMGSFRFSVDSREIVWSAAMYRVFDRDPKLGPPTLSEVMSHVHPDDASRVTALRNEAILRGDGYECDIRIRHRNGEYRWCRNVARCHLDANGQTATITGTIMDIHDRKIAEQRLTASEAGLHRAQELAHIGSWTLDLRTGEGIWSREMYRLCGLPEQPVPPPFVEYLAVVHPEDRARVAKHAATADGDEIEYRLLLENGTIRFVHALCEVRRDASGSPESISGTLMDISERKRTQAELAKSEERFRSAIGSMHEGLVVQNRSGEIYIANDRACEILGLTIDQLNGRSSIDEHWMCIHEDGTPWPGEEHPSMTVLATGLPVYDQVMGVRKPTGELAWVAVNAVPLFAASESRPYAVVVTFSEITQRKIADEIMREQMATIHRANAQLQIQRVELEDANRRLEALATTDGLTGINNRRVFQESLANEIERSRRNEQPLSLMILDVDAFKSYNDLFGHPAGDVVLQRFAQLLLDNRRSIDFVARYGGEEFVVILPNVEAGAAIQVAERLRQSVELTEWPLRAITVSIGVATLAASTDGLESFVAEADQALYRSKRNGRNRVTHAADAFTSRQ